MRTSPRRSYEETIHAGLSRWFTMENLRRYCFGVGGRYRWAAPALPRRRASEIRCFLYLGLQAQHEKASAHRKEDRPASGGRCLGVFCLVTRAPLASALPRAGCNTRRVEWLRMLVRGLVVVPSARDWSSNEKKSWWRWAAPGNWVEANRRKATVVPTAPRVGCSGVRDGQPPSARTFVQRPYEVHHT